MASTPPMNLAGSSNRLGGRAARAVHGLDVLDTATGRERNQCTTVAASVAPMAVAAIGTSHPAPAGRGPR